MNCFKLLVSLTMVLTLVLMVSGCAKPPEVEQKAAKIAMDAAITVRADKYAVADMEGAIKLFNVAEVQMKEKKYAESKKGYMDAKAGFEKACSSADMGKKAIAAEAIVALAALEESWKSLQAAAKKVEKSMKEKKEAWEGDVNTFEEGLKTSKEMITTDPAGAKWKADTLKAVIEKWDSTFKELALAPNPEKKKGKK